MKKSDLTSEASRGLPYEMPTLERVSNFCFVQNLQHIASWAQSFGSVRVIFGFEVEWVLARFDLLYPYAPVLGPIGWVICSTPGGPPNHPQRVLVGVTITDL